MQPTEKWHVCVHVQARYVGPSGGNKVLGGLLLHSVRRRTDQLASVDQNPDFTGVGVTYIHTLIYIYSIYIHMHT